MKIIFKLLCLSTFLFFFNGIGQYRFIYEVKYKIDTANLDHTETEYFNLDYRDGNSIFYNAAFARLDSMVAKGGSLYRDNVPSPKLDLLVTKDLKANKVNFVEMLGLTLYSIQEPRSLVWKIENETKEITTKKVQKATTEFAGRKLVAWFSTEINIPDGPYKFHGLPGLIMELYDEKNHYTFQLHKIMNIDKIFSLQSFQKLGIKTIPLEFEKYIGLKKEYEEYPEKFFYDMFNANNVKVESTIIREMVLQSKIRRSKKNNPIELSDK